MKKSLGHDLPTSVNVRDFPSAKIGENKTLAKISELTITVASDNSRGVSVCSMIVKNLEWGQQYSKLYFEEVN